jgi:hypothetical protein
LPSGPILLAIVFAGCKADDLDRDQDGSVASADCDDANPSVHPDAHEYCDGLDNDCDQEIDEGVQREFHVDADGDSYGASKTVLGCGVADGIVVDGTDCDDDDAGVHPGVEDLCDGRDDDCDGQDGAPQSWYADTDEDGFGDALAQALECAAPDGFVAVAGDCDDDDSAVNPDAVESCDNTIDDDCDGVIADEIDHDGDGGYSDACPGGTDCDESDATIHIGAVETCGDGIDSDCSGADLPCDTFDGDYDLADAGALVNGPPGSLADGGRVVQSGDVTGDGIDDIFAGTLGAHGGYGGGWVVPGPVSGSVALADVGFDLEATAATMGAGRSIGLGDVSGDGIGDVAFGCPYSFPAGQYIVFGPVTADAQITAAYDAAIAGPKIGDLFAHGSDLGDVDGDGTADSVIAAWAGGIGGKIQSGTLWVTLGPLSGDLDPDLDADAIVAGEHEGAHAGRIVHVDDDLDGDGLEDIVVNAVHDATGGTSAGGLYVVYGPADISSLADAAQLVGPAPSAFAGQEFTSGDYDGDGYGEVAAYATPAGASGVYVARGPLPDETDLGVADIILQSDKGSDELGSGLGSGDLSGDGITDLLVGAPSGEFQSGVTYLLIDPPSGTSVISDVAAATFHGDTWGSYSGQGLAVGDLNGDGSVDLLLGAPGLNGSGGVYVEYSGL